MEKNFIILGYNQRQLYIGNLCLGKMCDSFASFKHQAYLQGRGRFMFVVIKGDFQNI